MKKPKYSGKILIYAEPRWSAEGNYSGEGCWEIDLNFVSVAQLVRMLESLILALEEVNSSPDRDAKGRFTARAKSDG